MRDQIIEEICRRRILKHVVADPTNQAQQRVLVWPSGISGLAVEGSTFEEARRLLVDSIPAYVDAMLEVGEPIPPAAASKGFTASSVRFSGTGIELSPATMLSSGPVTVSEVKPGVETATVSVASAR